MQTGTKLYLLDGSTQPSTVEGYLRISKRSSCTAQKQHYLGLRQSNHHESPVMGTITTVKSTARIVLEVLVNNKTNASIMATPSIETLQAEAHIYNPETFFSKTGDTGNDSGSILFKYDSN